MKKRIMRITSVMLCLLMMAGLAACAVGSTAQTPAPSGNSPQSGGASEKPLVKFSVMNTSWDLVSGTRFPEYIKEKFNVEIEVLGAPWEKYPEKLRSLLAAGETPDCFWVNGVDSAEYRLVKNDGMILDLWPDIQKYPNLLKAIDLPDLKYLKEDGGLYGVPRPSLVEEGVSIGFSIRQDWLDKTGQKVPTNFDELYQLLKVFKEKDPDGQKNIGLVSASVDHLRALETYWTGQYTWGKSNGKYVSTMVNPDIKEAWKYFRKLYSEGLMDPEVFISTQQKSTDIMASGRSGVFLGVRRNPDFGRVVDAVEQAHPGVAFVHVPALEGPKGKVSRLSKQYFGLACFKKDIKDRERLLEIFDWLWTDEGTEFMNYGIEGVHYTKDASGKITSNQDELAKDNCSAKIYFSNIACDVALRFTRDNNPVDLMFRQLMADDAPYGVSNPLDYYGSTVKLEYESKLMQIYRNYQSKCVVGELDPDACWDDYIAEMKAAGYDKYEADANANAYAATLK